VIGSIPRIRFGEEIVMSPTFIPIVLAILEQLRTGNTYFFHCRFSERIWNYLQITWVQLNTMEDIVRHAKRDFNKPFFFEVIFIACWNIWKQRNNAVFERVLPTSKAWKGAFIHDITLHMCICTG
jgi:hypothetical protein